MAGKSRFGLILAAVLTAAALLTISIIIIPLAREPELDLELPDRGIEGSEIPGILWDGAARKPGSEMGSWNSGTKRSDAPAREEEPGPEGATARKSTDEPALEDEDLLSRYRDGTFTPRKFKIFGRVLFSDTGSPAPGAQLRLCSSISRVCWAINLIEKLKWHYSENPTTYMKEEIRKNERMVDQLMGIGDSTPGPVQEELIGYIRGTSPFWEGRSDDEGEFLVRFSTASHTLKGYGSWRDKERNTVLGWDLPCVMLIQASIENDEGTYYGELGLRLTEKETIEATIMMSREKTVKLAEVAGRVVNEMGEPIEGADVLVLNTKIMMRMGKRIYHKWNMKTDDEGRFKATGIPPSVRVAVKIVKPGYCTYGDNFLLPEAGVYREFVLKRKILVSGRVRDAMGGPLGGCRVFLVMDARDPDGAGGILSEILETGADGKFSGLVRPASERMKVMVYAGGFAPSTIELLLSDNKPVDIILDKGGGVVSGRVMKRGKPSRAEVSIVIPGSVITLWKARTGKDGKFRFDGLDENFKYVLIADGLDSWGNCDDMWDFEDDVRPPATGLTITLDNKMQDLPD